MGNNATDQSAPPTKPTSRLGTLTDRLLRASRRGVALWIRQSSERQKRYNTASADLQEEQKKFLSHYGVNVDDIKRYDARGESGKADADRPVFRELLSDVRAGRIALVVVASADRVARNRSDAEDLLDALTEQNGLIMVGGRPYDPGDPGHRMILGVLAVLAQHRNDVKTMRSVSTKGAKARQTALRIALPSGLVWATPQNPEYRRSLRDADMEEVISGDALSTHNAVSSKNGQNYYVLPLPDAEVQEAYDLAMEWLLESRDLSAVLDRIASDPAWPRSGCFPTHGSRRFDADKLQEARERHSEADTALWRRILNRSDGRDDTAAGKLRDWFRSPALYGTYRYRADALKRLSPRAADELGAHIREANAFPGLFPRNYRERVEEILSNPLGFAGEGGYEGPRNHRVPLLHCVELMPDDSRCGAKRHPAYRKERDGEYHYRSRRCVKRDHPSSCSSQLDRVVLQIVRETYDPNVLDDALQHIQREHDDADERRKILQKEIDELEAKMRVAVSKIEQAAVSGDLERQEIWDERFDDHRATRRQRQNELQELEAQAGQPIEESELEQLIQLGTDIPALLDKACEVESVGGPLEGAARRVLSILIDGVRLRKLGHRCYLAEVDFPGGSTRKCVFYTANMRVPQPLRAYARLQLGASVAPMNRTEWDAEHALRGRAKRLAERVNPIIDPQAPSHPYSGEQLLAAAVHFQCSAPNPREADSPERQTVVELADHHDVPEDRVWAQVLAGNLGPAQIENDQLLLAPEDEQLHSALPQAARSWVAGNEGWPVEDTRLLAECRDKDESWTKVARRAERRGALAHDCAGRRWTRTSAVPDSPSDELRSRLYAELPHRKDPDEGSWWPLKRVVDRLDVHKDTALAHGHVVRPGMGYLGARSVYIWVDDELRERLPGG